MPESSCVDQMINQELGLIQNFVFKSLQKYPCQTSLCYDSKLKTNDDVKIKIMNELQTLGWTVKISDNHLCLQIPFDLYP